MSSELSNQYQNFLSQYREAGMFGIVRLFEALDDATRCNMSGTLNILYENEAEPRDDEHVIQLERSTSGLGLYEPVAWFMFITEEHKGVAFDAACSRAADELGRRLLTGGHAPGRA